MLKELLLINIIDSSLYFRNESRKISNLHSFHSRFKVIITKSADDVITVASRNKSFFQFQQLVLIFNSGYFRTKLFQIVGSVSEQCLSNRLQPLNDFLGIFHYLYQHIGFVWRYTRFLRIIKPIQLLQIGFVCLIKVCLNICKIYDISIPVIFIRTIYSCNSLQKVMIFEFSSEVESL